MKAHEGSGGTGRTTRRALAALLTSGLMAGTTAAGVAAGSAFNAATAGAAGAGGSGWAATATKALPLANATPLGAAAPAQALDVSVAISARNPAGLAAMAAAASTPGNAGYGQFLTPSQVAARFAPSSAETGAVAAYLRAAGFRNVTVEPDGLFVDAQGDVATAERAFDTKIGSFAYGGRVVYANTAPALVPAQFGGAVLSVLGLSDLPMNLPHQLHSASTQIPAVVQQQIAELSATAAPDTSGFTPQQLAKIYDAASTPAGTRTSVAVLVSGNMTSTVADLRHAEQLDHAGQVPVSIVYTSAAPGVVNGNPYTGNLEWDLDTQMSTLVSGGVQREYLYDMATLDDADVARAINMFVEQDKATAGSASLGECDAQPWLDGTMAATDQVLEEGAVQGQSFFASSGDNGYACPEVASTGAPGGAPGASWPADGTWTTAVGGTSLLATSAGTYQEELSWIGGGGGLSEFETPGNWTSVANAAAAAVEYLPMGSRGIPDVAADADPNVSPVVVWQGKNQNLVGGTSVSSPLVLGLWARMQTAHQNRLGVASLDFYRLYNKVNKLGSKPTEPAGFRDIVLGSNGLYTALPGYDFTTGIGSLDVAALSKAIG